MDRSVFSMMSTILWMLVIVVDFGPGTWPFVLPSIDIILSRLVSSFFIRFVFWIDSHPFLDLFNLVNQDALGGIDCASFRIARDVLIRSEARFRFRLYFSTSSK
jgi:hypothetical protein